MAAEASVDGTPPVNRRFRPRRREPTRSTHKEPRRVKRRCSGRGPALGVSPFYAGERYGKSRNKTNVEQLLTGSRGRSPRASLVPFFAEERNRTVAGGRDN